jgi:hypothetical protein
MTCAGLRSLTIALNDKIGLVGPWPAMAAGLAFPAACAHAFDGFSLDRGVHARDASRLSRELINGPIKVGSHSPDRGSSDLPDGIRG